MQDKLNASFKNPWRWLTTKAKRLSIKEDPPRQTKRASFTNSTSLPKPEPALHRLQELKSPPPIPPQASTIGSDSPGFKSRLLYRRTHSNPANRTEEEGRGGSGENVRNTTPSAWVVKGLVKNASGTDSIRHSHEGEDGRTSSASEGGDDGGSGCDKDGSAGGSGSGRERSGGGGDGDDSGCGREDPSSRGDGCLYDPRK